MHDPEGTKTDTATADDEQAEALSRAARQAVRQPADPRLEKSFAKLGLFSDDETPAVTAVSPAPAPEPAPAASSPGLDLDPLRAEIAALRAATEQAERRLTIVMYAVMGALVALGLLIVVVLAR
jgi:hypothetical protein